MPIEFERKYLVSGPDWRNHVEKELEIAQGYLSISDRSSIRVRISEPDAWLTIKGARQGTGRPEFEYAIPVREARMLLETLSVSRVAKTRHFVESTFGQWTVDIFHGENEGLVLLEIESTAEFAVDALPEWVGREVTDDDRFANAYLSEHPYQTWGP